MKLLILAIFISVNIAFIHGIKQLTASEDKIYNIKVNLTKPIKHLTPDDGVLLNFYSQNKPLSTPFIMYPGLFSNISMSEVQILATVIRYHTKNTELSIDIKFNSATNGSVLRIYQFNSKGISDQIKYTENIQLNGVLLFERSLEVFIKWDIELIQVSEDHLIDRMVHKCIGYIKCTVQNGYPWAKAQIIGLDKGTDEYTMDKKRNMNRVVRKLNAEKSDNNKMVGCKVDDQVKYMKLNVLYYPETVEVKGKIYKGLVSPESSLVCKVGESNPKSKGKWIPIDLRYQDLKKEGITIAGDLLKVGVRALDSETVFKFICTADSEVIDVSQTIPQQKIEFRVKLFEGPYWYEIFIICCLSFSVFVIVVLIILLCENRRRGMKIHDDEATLTLPESKLKAPTKAKPDERSNDVEMTEHSQENDRDTLKNSDTSSEQPISEQDFRKSTLKNYQVYSV